MARRKGAEGEAAARLRAAAGRAFRTCGYGGAGIDGLAREAGLTSGAFYAQFRSKADAFRAAVEDGFAFYLRGLEATRAAHGDGWIGPFIDFYLGARMEVGLDEACAAPTFAADVARADAETRAAYGAGLRALTEAVAGGLDGPDRDERAAALVALLAGGAGLARAVAEPAQRRALIDATRAAARGLAGLR